MVDDCLDCTLIVGPCNGRYTRDVVIHLIVITVDKMELDE